MKYNNADDPAVYAQQMEQKLRQLSPAQANEIMEARKIGLTTREQMVMELLDKYLG